MKEVVIGIEGVSLVEFFGVNNQKLDIIKRAYPGVKVSARGSNLKITGNLNQVDLFEQNVEKILIFLRRYGNISINNLELLLLGQNTHDSTSDENQSKSNVILYSKGGKPITARTPNQKKMVETSADNDVLFAIGPAGTGKTYTAVALAVKALKERQVKRIILTRPAVEAGESLGFLPGDLKDKIDPYLRPLYDALNDMIPHEKLELFMENGIIEVAPLAYMRGRTLDNAFIILDEAQNTTDSQLRMFLTRLGPTAKCIVTGDITQIDLPRNVKSGLRKSVNILKDISGISLVRLTEEDVIRHKLVKDIIRAYEKFENEAKEKNNRDS